MPSRLPQHNLPGPRYLAPRAARLPSTGVPRGTEREKERKTEEGKGGEGWGRERRGEERGVSLKVSSDAYS